MKILLITEDPNLISSFSKDLLPSEFQTEIFSCKNNLLDIVSRVYSNNFSVIVIDDDCVGNNTLNLLKSIRTMKKNTKIIFLTSDNSIEKGREILPLGILYYGIKPVSHQELLQVLDSSKKILTQ
jgi:DNA-binding response OmpR family regulator